MVGDYFSAPSVLLLAEYGSTGGTRTYFKQLLALYAEKCVRVTVLRTYEKDDEEIDNLCRVYGFRCVGLSSITRKRNIFQGRFPFRLLLERRLFKDFVRNANPDLVVVSVGTPELFLGVLGLSKKAIYILHTYPRISRRRYLGPLKRLLFSMFVPSAARILTVSEFSKNCILHAWGLGARSINVMVVYSTMGSVPKTRVLPKTDVVQVLTVGHVEAYKNPDTWIGMAVLLKKNVFGVDVRFTWVGDGAMLDGCREKVKGLGAESYIEFVGRDNAVAKYYEQCDIYVQPSHIESLGLAVLDAMRYGRPCIVANTGGLPEAVCDGKTGWVVGADDAETMAQKVGDLVRDEELREAMGQQALRMYEKMFSSERWADEMWRHHENMLGA